MKLKLFAAAAALAVSGVAFAGDVDLGTLTAGTYDLPGFGDTTFTFSLADFYTGSASFTFTVTGTSATNPVVGIYFDGALPFALDTTTIGKAKYYLYADEEYSLIGPHTISVDMNKDIAYTGSLTLTFESHGDNPTPVPEPESYALALAGLGVVGMLSRRRKAA